MSDLNAERKSINEIFSNPKTKFLIPDYQRPYSWTTDHCETLWADFKEFAFPNDDVESFDEDKDEYFLGTILTFNDNGCSQQEVVDGQQRLITLLLLLRAFYDAFGESETEPRSELSKCIWRLKNYKPDFSTCKIDYEVVDDENSDSFKKIIAEGVTDKSDKSNYAENYRYFQRELTKFKLTSPDKFSIFPQRILNNCILLPIVTNSQNTALRIFTTLNDRGMPLSDADIFKAQFYKFYRAKGKVEKENFVSRWKELDRLCNKNFHPRRNFRRSILSLKLNTFTPSNAMNFRRLPMNRTLNVSATRLYLKSALTFAPQIIALPISLNTISATRMANKKSPVP